MGVYLISVDMMLDFCFLVMIERVLVLDEVDEMLCMGFIEDVE